MAGETTSNDRFSIPLSDEEKARIEARNAIRQFDWAVAYIDNAIQSGNPPVLADLSILNYLAVKGVRADAGQLRAYPVYIRNAEHKPPPYEHVRRDVDEMLEYVSSNWTKSPLHLSSYLLWRLNWIHPFGEGNGRTARMISYIVLCVRIGVLLPGSRTIPEQIATNRSPYYRALQSADIAWSMEETDVSEMENLMEELLATQLAELLSRANEGS